jgi:hypothetical protein
LAEVFKLAVEKRGDKVALQVERNGLEPLAPGSKKAPPPLPLENWTKQTYKEYYDQICLAGRAMLVLGLEKYDGVNIYGFNSPEWFAGAIGGVFAGGIDAGECTVFFFNRTRKNGLNQQLHQGFTLRTLRTKWSTNLSTQGPPLQLWKAESKLRYGQMDKAISLTGSNTACLLVCFRFSWMLLPACQS